MKGISAEGVCTAARLHEMIVRLRIWTWLRTTVVHPEKRKRKAKDFMCAITKREDSEQRQGEGGRRGSCCYAIEWNCL